MVVDDPDAARDLMAGGTDVVLIVAAGGDHAVATGDPPAGRIAVFVGDPSDPATWSAAAEMDAELFTPRR